MNPFNFIGGFFSLFFIMFFGIVALFVFVIVGSIAKAAATSVQNDASPILALPTTVVTKRTQVSGNEHSFTHYYATFEFEDGQRTEFSVKGNEFGMLAEGDQGLLRYQGTRYLGFTRQLH